MADSPLPALRSVLVGAGFARVYAQRLPADQAPHMPRATIILRGAGGGQLAQGYMAEVDARIEVRCYGQDPDDALSQADAIGALLHNLRRTTTPYGTIHWCKASSLAQQIVEPETGWDVVLSTWQVYGSWLRED